MALPLSRHLKHRSRTLIRDRYVANDPMLLEEVDDAMARTLARTLVAIASGEEKIVGYLADLMRRHIAEITALISGLDGEAAIAIVQDWAKERQLGLFIAGPGKCGIRLMPQNALCHAVAGTADWTRRFESVSRTDEDCSNCKCCIFDTEHLHFWTSRYCRSRQQVLISRSLGREGESWVHAGQAAAAKRMLLRLEARIPPDEELMP